MGQGSQIRVGPRKFVFFLCLKNWLLLSSPFFFWIAFIKIFVLGRCATIAMTGSDVLLQCAAHWRAPNWAKFQRLFITFFHIICTALSRLRIVLTMNILQMNVFILSLPFMRFEYPLDKCISEFLWRRPWNIDNRLWKSLSQRLIWIVMFPRNELLIGISPGTDSPEIMLTSCLWPERQELSSWVLLVGWCSWIQKSPDCQSELGRQGAPILANLNPSYPVIWSRDHWNPLERWRTVAILFVDGYSFVQ
jgi:hypothetical protein